VVRNALGAADLAYPGEVVAPRDLLRIHCAPPGTHERFIGFLIEHYAGNFPLWLSPGQVRILPIGDEPKLLDYARSVQTELRSHQVRYELDASTDHIKSKIANAEQMKVHTMLVIGNRDLEANAVSLRVHGQRQSQRQAAR
jgi:threonyl-tRNA synthetase